MRIKVLRYPPEGAGEGWVATYELPELEGASISNALQYINRHIDSSLAYYLTCRRGMCVGCAVKVNGKNATACIVPVEDGMTIEPIERDLVVKDTVVDLSMVRDARFELDDDAPDAAAAEAAGAAAEMGEKNGVSR